MGAQCFSMLQLSSSDSDSLWEFDLMSKIEKKSLYSLRHKHVFFYFNKIFFVIFECMENKINLPSVNTF